jgi:hypothetical protein
MLANSAAPEVNADQNNDFQLNVISYATTLYISIISN